MRDRLHRPGLSALSGSPFPGVPQRTFQSVPSQELLSGISVIVNTQPRERQEKLTYFGLINGQRSIRAALFSSTLWEDSAEYVPYRESSRLYARLVFASGNVSYVLWEVWFNFGER